MNDKQTMEQLTGHRERFYTELRARLDVEAGLTEVLLSQRHTDFSETLGGKLDVEAGLAAIVPAPPTPELSVPEKRGTLEWATVELATMPLRYRLILRGCCAPTLGQLAHQLLTLPVTDIDGGLGSRLQLAMMEKLPPMPPKQSLDPLSATNADSSRVREAMEQAMERFPSTPLDSGPDLVIPGHSIIEVKHGSRPEGAEWILLNLLNDPPADLISIASTPIELGRERDTQMWRWAEAIAVHLYREAKELFDLTVESSVESTARLWLDKIADYAAALETLLNDFTGVDLRNVELAGLPLEGLRWSIESTRWPDDWFDQIKDDSVELGDGIYEIHYGSHTSASHSTRV